MNDETYEKHYGALGKTLDEMLSHDEVERDTLYDAIFLRLDRKPNYASYNDAELKYREVYLLVGEVGNGGFHSYFNNGTGESADIALAGLQEMGADDAAVLLEQALKIFPGGKPPVEDSEKLQEAMEQVDDETIRIWGECSDEFNNQQAEIIRKLAVEYVKLRREEFHLP